MSDFEDALQGWIDDDSPELGFLSRAQLEQTTFFQNFKADWSAGNRSAGAARGAETRKRNAAAGISQKNLTGSPKQKQWAAKIRGEFVTGRSDPSTAYMAEHGSSKMWIDNRTTLRELHYKIGVAREKIAAAVIAWDARMEGRPSSNTLTDPADISAYEAISLARRDLRNLVER